ncbi:tetratricopeptide repeat protein, partial [Actinoallomurus acaciae]
GAARVAELCGRLPLALRIAGARLAAHPDLSLSAFADRLSDARRRLDELRHADLAVRTSFTASLEGLAAEPDGDTLVRTFVLLGLLDGPDVATPVVTALTGLSPEHTRTALERLAEAQLLSAAGPGRYGMHDLVRLYARERAHEDLPEETRAAAWGRAMRHYLATCRSAALMLDQSPDHRHSIGPATRPEDQGEVRFADRRAAIRWIDAEHDNLLAAVRQAATASGDEGPSFATGLSAALFRPFDMRGKYEDRVTVGRLALGAACRIGDLCAEAQALNDLGWACLVAGDLDAAVDHLERSVARWRQTDMRLGTAYSVANLGSLYASQRNNEAALINCRWSVEVFREVGDRHGEARALINLASSHQRSGRYAEAIAANERSLELHTELGHPRGQAIASGNLAESHRLNGSPDLAVPLFERAITAIREVGDRGAEAEFHWFLGAALYTLGHHDRARDRWRRSVALLQDMGALSADEAEAILADPVPETPEPILRTM